MANKFSDIIKNLDEILEGNHLTRMLPERYSSTPTKSFASKDEAAKYAQSLVTQFKSYKTKLQATADRLNNTLTSLLATKNQKNTDTTIKWEMVKVFADVATASYSDFIYNSSGIKRHLMNTNRFTDAVYWNTDKTIDDGLWKGMAHWVSPSWGVPWTQYTQLLVSATEKQKAQALMGAGKTEPGVTTTTVTTTTTTGSGQSSSSSTTTTTTDWYPTPWDCNSGYWDSNAGYWDGDQIDRGWIWGTNGSKGPNQIMLQKADYGHVMMNQMGPLTTQLNKWVQYYKNICQIATLNSAHAIKKHFDEVVTPSVPKKYYDTTSISRNYDYDFDTSYIGKDTANANNTYKAQEMVGKFMADYNYNTLPNATSQTVSGTTDEANLVYYGYFDYNNNTTNYTTPGFLSQYMASTSSTTAPSVITRLQNNNIDTLAELLERYDGLKSYNVITPDSLITVEQYFYDTLDSVKAGWKAKTGMTLSPYALGTAKSDGSANTTGVASKPDGSSLNTTNGTVNISSDSLAKSTTRNNTRWTNQTSIPSALASSTSTAESPVYAINMTTGATTYVNIPDPDHVVTSTTNGAPCQITYQVGTGSNLNQVEKLTTAATGAVYGCTSIIIYKRWHQTEWYLCGPNTVPSNAGTESYQYARKFEQNKADFSQYQRLITRLYNDANTILTWALGKYDTDGSVAKYIKAQGGIISEPWGMIYVVNDYYNWSDDTWLYNFLQYSCRYNKDLMVFKSDILSGSVKPDSNDY
jgi:hypothetical protein